LYGVKPKYSYFNGCSTGGRQGLMEAQRYPEDYDGIMSGSPAINWQKLHVMQMWGPVVMNAMGNPVANCKLQAATNAAVAACDGIDKVTDGVIEDPTRCTYDAKSLVGTMTACGAVTAKDADVINKLWEGPQTPDGKPLWIGQPKGADLTAIWGTRGDPPQAAPFGISIEWYRFWLSQNPQLDGNSITWDQFVRFFEQSVEQYSAVIGTDNPDLRAFQARGGKAIVWHGWTDQLISAHGAVDYYKRVMATMGADNAANFIRLFMAPGIGHCGGGTGPNPTGQMEALLAWVEDGKAPDTLPASRQTPEGPRTRILCAYPQVPKYKGSGSTNDAANFSCSTGF
jgi:hypothetical protein